MTEIKKIDLSRRSFLVGTVATTGLVMGYSAVTELASAAEKMTMANFDPSIWYSIDHKGVVTVTVGKAEMGQHVSSTMAQIIVEELGADWKDVRISFPVADPKYADPVLGAIVTGGSWSTNFNFDTMSRAGAAGRITLIEAGAGIMGVPASECMAQNSRVVHPKSGKQITFARIVESGKATKTWTADEMKAIKLKSFDQYQVIGHSLPQLDIPPKTNGTAKYGIDHFVPGMVYARPVVPPVRYGAKVKSIDDTAAKKVKGYETTVALDDKTGTITGWVAVIAKTYEAAIAASDAIKVDWDLGPNAKVSDATLIDHARKLTADPNSGFFFVKNGDTGAAFGSAAKVLEAEYTTSIAVHAPIEPMNAVVEEKNGVWHIYAGNQFATRSGAIAAAALGVDPKNVVCHLVFLGGGFGRRLEGDMMIAAALASKGAGKPVKLIYSRQTDTTMDFTRPLAYEKVKAALDANGRVVAMNHDVCCAWPTARWQIPAFLSPSVDKKGNLDAFTVNGADYWYTVPNHNVRAILNDMAQAATPSGQLRAVAPGWTFWAVESIVDELAHAAGKDPLEFRLAMLDGAGENAGGAQRIANVLRTAAGRAGYGSLKLPKGEGMGIACVSAQERGTASWTACVAHVAVAASGEVTVKKLTVVTDIGTAVNPDGVLAQLEGASLWGMSLALFERQTIEDGGLQANNFDTYTPMRMAQVPNLDVSFIANGEHAAGTGEPAVTVVGPAIANAIFQASGARVRSLPMTADAVKKAMKA
jgi:isoquinoline 1-oxidoreductase subunit beta